MADSEKKSIFDNPDYDSPFGDWEQDDEQYIVNPKMGIKEITGSDEIFIGKSYLYAVTGFAGKENLSNKNMLNWGYCADGKSIIPIDKKYYKEHSIFWKIPQLEAKKIKVYAWYESSNISASYESKILQALAIDRKVLLRQIPSILKKQSLNKTELDGLNEILNERDLAYAGISLKQFAYILATITHESKELVTNSKGKKEWSYFQPVEEKRGGSNSNKWYWDKYKSEKDQKNKITYSDYDKVYFGRGYGQLTGYDNYKKFSVLVDENLLEHPEYLITNHNLSLIVTFEGMMEGLFTTRKLGDYLNNKKSDWINARRVVNGTYEAKTIADIAMKYHDALIEATIPEYLKSNEIETEDSKKKAEDSKEEPDSKVRLPHG